MEAIMLRVSVSVERVFHILLGIPEGPGAVLLSLQMAVLISSMEGVESRLCKMFFWLIEASASSSKTGVRS